MFDEWLKLIENCFSSNENQIIKENWSEDLREWYMNKLPLSLSRELLESRLRNLKEQEIGEFIISKWKNFRPVD